MELMKVKVCFDVEEEEVEKIDVIAKREERSRSFVLREAVKQYVEKVGSG